jgi:hypothetical protein
MNTGFSISRLWKLIVKYAIENGRSYLLTILALVGCQAIFFIIWLRGMSPHFNETPLYIFYGVGLLMSGCVVASQSLSVLGHKTRGTYWLSVPASHAEKLITSILYTTVIFFILYSLGFLLLRSATIAYAQSIPGSIIEPLNPNFKLGNPIGSSVFAFVAIQALYMLGSVYFSSYSLVKTTLFGVIFLFLYMLYYKFLNDHLLGDGYIWRGLDIMHVSEREFEGFQVYSAEPWIKTVLIWIFKLGWAPVFWIITWFRIREKQL